MKLVYKSYNVYDTNRPLFLFSKMLGYWPSKYRVCVIITAKIKSLIFLFYLLLIALGESVYLSQYRPLHFYVGFEPGHFVQNARSEAVCQSDQFKDTEHGIVAANGTLNVA